MDHERFSIRRMRENARIQPMREGSGWKRKILFHFSIFGVAFCISCLYHGMRPLMRLGGMVASGGPYAIEHPAPPWVWIMPVAIILGMVCFFLNLFSSGEEGVNLIPLAWPALFLSLGWNFLEFTFSPPGGGIAWGWLVCGVVFVLMGGLPLLLAFKSMGEKIRSRSQSDQGLKPYAVQWLLVGAGVYLGIVFFRSVAG
jgi:hypothetical protein